jgi:hypothetical protein
VTVTVTVTVSTRAIISDRRCGRHGHGVFILATSSKGRSMHCMRSVRGCFIFHSQGPSLKVHHGQCLRSVTKHDSGGSPPGAACDGEKPPHDKMQGSASRRWSRLSPYLPNGHGNGHGHEVTFPSAKNFPSRVQCRKANARSWPPRLCFFLHTRAGPWHTFCKGPRLREINHHV